MNRENRSERQMSDSLLTAVFLTLSGGFQDAYTFFFRGGVYANAQTGNVVQMGTELFKGNVQGALWYLLPIFSFMAGIWVSIAVCRRRAAVSAIHWRQQILLAEIVILFGVAFIPKSADFAATSLVSFVCAMQVQAFRKVGDQSYASTMCIGNIRSGVEALSRYMYEKDRNSLVRFFKYAALILIFAAGAGMGYYLSVLWGGRSIWCSCALLFVGFCLMCRRQDTAESD